MVSGRKRRQWGCAEAVTLGLSEGDLGLLGRVILVRKHRPWLQSLLYRFLEDGGIKQPGLKCGVKVLLDYKSYTDSFLHCGVVSARQEEIQQALAE